MEWYEKHKKTFPCNWKGFDSIPKNLIYRFSKTIISILFGFHKEGMNGRQKDAFEKYS